MSRGACESCGSDDEVVVSVHRVYLALGEWDAEPAVQVIAQTELWCTVCQDHYPHQPA